jgi:multidrug resistance efflux pump
MSKLAMALLTTWVVACHPRGTLPYAGFVDEPVAPVAAQQSGRVVAIPVREGDRVTKGELLARLDSREAEAEVAQALANLDRAQHALAQARANFHVALPAVTGATADVAKARAALELARLQYERDQRLFATKAITESDLDTSRATFEEAQASVSSLLASRAQARHRVPAASAVVADAQSGVEAAEAALDLARTRLEQTRIRSPFDGMVVSRNLEEGQWAATGMPVVTVEETAHPWVRLDVPETTFRGLEMGSRARIQVVALGDRTFDGRVTQIGAEGDFAIDQDVKRGRPNVRTFLVRVAFDQPPAALRPGMTASVTLTGGPPAPSAPVAANRSP